jgi:hypothetical protein
MTTAWLPLACALSLAAGGASAQVERQVCRLLKPDEVKALVGPDIVMANVLEEGDDRSVCQYETGDAPALVLTIYWRGGRKQWDASMASLATGDKMLAGSEGVGIDSLAKAGAVKAGSVQGLGDRAYFSDVLPSLVLKGDVLLEMNLALLKDAGAKFRPLAERILGRI